MHGLARLTRVTLRSGALAGLVPESMRFAWAVLAGRVVCLASIEAAGGEAAA